MLLHFRDLVLLIGCIKYLGAIKYKTMKPVSHAQHAPQVLDFNHAQLLVIGLTITTFKSRQNLCES